MQQANADTTSLLQAASDIRFNPLLARDLLASSNATATVIPLLQPASLPFAFGGGIPVITGQVAGGQSVELNPLLNGIVGRAGDPLFLQQALANHPGSVLVGQNPAVSGVTPGLPLPVSSILPLNQPVPSVLSSTPRRGRPTSQEVQDAIATIAAAGVSMPTLQATSSVAEGGHPPVVVYMECDEESLSDYQCLLRKQVELFEATADDVQWNAQGRNKAIVLGQVGIRCRYCARLPTWSRARGAVYYSATLDGLYQAAQNMAKNHLCRHCRLLPEDVRQKLISLRDCKRRAAGGKKYWAEGAKVLGVHECIDGLRFKDSSTGASVKK